MEGTFKRDNSFDKRLELSQRILKKYPDHVPVIVELMPNSNIKLSRTKLLVPSTSSMGALLTKIRELASIKPEEALFLFCGGGQLVPISSLISQAYKQHKDKDGFLYITIALENTFGFFCEQILDEVLQKSVKTVKFIQNLI